MLKSSVNKYFIPLAIIFNCFKVYSQSMPIRNMNLTKTKIEFSFIDSTIPNERYKRISCKDNLSYYVANSAKIFINPFLNSSNTKLINKQLIDFIREDYDYELALKRITYNTQFEGFGLFLKIDTNGIITNYGFYFNTDQKVFEKEIYQILKTETLKNLVFPICNFDKKNYDYITTLIITNNDLYK
jgi:hypothetical protein